MANFLRRISTTVVAIFLWCHALFALAGDSQAIEKLGAYVHLTLTESVIICVIVVLSLLTGAGFWRSVGSALYIYCFPFVLAWMLLRSVFLFLRSVNRWLQARSPKKNEQVIVEASKIDRTVATQTAQEVNEIIRDDGTKAKASKRFRSALLYISSPFRKFVLLWCMLLLLTPHQGIASVCLVVVLFQLTVRIYTVCKWAISFDSWLKRRGPSAFTELKKTVENVEDFDASTSSEKELKDLLGQIDAWRKILRFFENQYLISRWTWICGAAVFTALYLYFSVLFSFGYFGIARANALAYSWQDSLVTAVFIPAYVTDLPNIAAIRVLGGVQFTLALLLGIGTVMNFMQRRLETIYQSAADWSARIAAESVQGKFLLIQEAVDEQSEVDRAEKRVNVAEKPKPSGSQRRKRSTINPKKISGEETD